MKKWSKFLLYLTLAASLSMSAIPSIAADDECVVDLSTRACSSGGVDSSTGSQFRNLHLTAANELLTFASSAATVTVSFAPNTVFSESTYTIGPALTADISPPATATWMELTRDGTSTLRFSTTATAPSAVFGSFCYVDCSLSREGVEISSFRAYNAGAASVTVHVSYGWRAP